MIKGREKPVWQAFVSFCSSLAVQLVNVFLLLASFRIALTTWILWRLKRVTDCFGIGVQFLLEAETEQLIKSGST